jgi:putative addiction module component (TIGR02574 family)
MSTTYHIRIKKEYAAALIEDLQKTDAVELIEKHEDDVDISDEQVAEVRRRIAYYDANPGKLLSWDEVRKRLKMG